MLYNILFFTSFILDESIHISKISVEIFEYDKYCYIYPHKQKLWGFSKISNIQRGLGTKSLRTTGLYVFPISTNVFIIFPVISS